MPRIVAPVLFLSLIPLFQACARHGAERWECDIAILDGLVVDGSGAAGRAGHDVLIRGDRIVFVGDLDNASIDAHAVVDARRKVVAPGFVDVHAHGDPMRHGHFRNFLAMGVTTVCLGMDGASPTPRALGPWLDTLDRRPLGPNVVAFVGHGSARSRAGLPESADGEGPAPRLLEALTAEVRAGIAAGAFGLTTGLEYEPGRFAGPEELVAAARPVAAVSGLVMSHVRSEDEPAIHASLDELFAQCRDAGCAAHVSHLKVVYGHGATRAEQLLAQLERARGDGLRVTADVYPYTASYTGIGIVFPPWARPPADFDAVRSSRRDELVAWIRQRVTLRNGPAATVFGSGRFAGRSLAEVAAELGKPFEDVLVDDVGPKGASAAYFVMDDALMRRLVVAPHVMIASDGSPTMRHPRGHGTFARVLATFVREDELLPLETAIHKMSGLPAETVGLDGRGELGVGAFADVVVFELENVQDRATFEDPFQLAEGFDQVVVGGTFAIRDGAFTDARPGRVLRSR